MSDTIRLDDLLQNYDSAPQDAQAATKPILSTQVPVAVLDQHISTPVVDHDKYDTWFESLFKKTVNAADGPVDAATEMAASAVKAVPDMVDNIIAGGLRLAGDAFNGEIATTGEFKERKTGLAGKAQELSALGFYLHAQTQNFKVKMAQEMDHPLAADIGTGVGSVSFAVLASMINPMIAIGAFSGDITATKYLQRRAKDAPWLPSIGFASAVGLVQGSLMHMSLGILSKTFASRWAMIGDSIATFAAQSAAQSLVNSVADELVGDRPFDPMKDIQDAAFEAGIGAIVGGITGVSSVNFAYSRINQSLSKLGVPAAERETLASQILHSGNDVVANIIKEHSNVAQADLDRFGQFMRGEVDAKDFMLSVDNKNDGDLRKRFVKLKFDEPQMQKEVAAQEVKDLPLAVSAPQELTKPVKITPDITEAAKTIIEGRSRQLDAEILAGEDKITQMNQQLADLQNTGAAHQDMLDRLNAELNKVDELYVQQRDLTDYTINELKNKNIQVTGGQVERVRKLARRVGEQEGRRKLAEKMKDESITIDARKSVVIDYVKQYIPRQYRGEFLTAIRDVKTDINLSKVIDRIYQKSDEYRGKILHQKMEEALTKLEPELDSGRVQRGRFGSAAIQDVANHIRQIAKMSPDTVELNKAVNQQKIQDIVENGADGDPALINFETELLDKFGGVAAELNPERLATSLRALQDITRNLKTFGKAVLSEEIAQKEQRLGGITLEIRPPQLEQKLESIRGTFKEKLRDFNQKFFGWGAGSSLNLGTMLKLLDNSRGKRGELSAVADNLVDATRRESAYNEQLTQYFQMAFKDVYKVKSASEIEEKLRRDLSFEERDGAFKASLLLNNGKTQDLHVNRSTIRYWYMLAHDMEGKPIAEAWETLTGQNAFTAEMTKAADEGRVPDLSKVRGNAIPESELKRMFSSLSEADKAFTARQRAFYNQTYMLVNPVYRRVFGTDLPKIENYTPRARQVDKSASDMFSLIEDVTNQFGAARPGFARTRKENASAPFKEIGDVQVINNMILEGSHFMGTYETVRDVFSILRDKDIRDAINEVSDGTRLKNGEWSDGPTYKNMLTLAQVVGSRGRMHMEINRMAQALNRNLSAGAVAGQLELGVAQQLSFLSALDGVTVKDAHEGVIDFFKSPKAVSEVLGKSPIMKMRYQNILLEMQDLASSSKLGNLSRSQDWRAHLFLPLKLGDRGAVLLGGWIRFRTEYMKTGDIDKAYKAFDHWVENTQQSGNLTQISTSQTGYGRVLFKFLSAPQQYFRRELLTLHDAALGRIPPAEAIKNLFVYHFMLSGFYNMAKNLFHVEDNQVAQATLVGPLVGIPVIGAIVEQLTMIGLNAVNYSLTGERSKGRINDVNIPLMSMGQEVMRNLNTAERNFEKDKFFSMVDASILAAENTAALTMGVPKQFGEIFRGVLAVGHGDLPPEAIPLILYGRTVGQAKEFFGE